MPTVKAVRTERLLCQRPHPVDDRHDADRDPEREDEEGADIEVIAFPWLRLLLVLVQRQHGPENDERGEEHQRDLPVLPEMREQTQQPDEERDPERGRPAHSRILRISLRTDEVPEQIPEEHVVQLVPEHEIHSRWCNWCRSPC